MNNSPSVAPRKDFGFIAIVVFVISIAVWLMMMPVLPSIASATLHRFHLRTESFALWAMQFPIPAMYNFANWYEVLEVPPDASDPSPSESPTDARRMINHFPARIATFGDARYRYLRAGEDRWISIESSYRGQSIRTVFHAEAIGDGGFRLIRLPEPEASP